MSAIICSGIEGSNPLGFLAALGAFRMCDLTWPGSRVALRWIREAGWKPEISGLPVADGPALCHALHESGKWSPLEAFKGLGNNITVPAAEFAQAVRSAAAVVSREDRRAADFAAAFGNEAFEDAEKGRIEPTLLCFITGSGHQHFLGTAKGLAASSGREHLQEALFGPWGYADKGLSMRWDPDDAKEYALRWYNPSAGGVSSIWGANRLAFEALPLFPTVPTERGLRTTAFRKRKGGIHEFTWPVWSHAVTVDTIRSLLALRELEADEPDRGELRARGIEDAFRVQRVRIGQGANFKVSFRPARSV